MVTAKMRFHHGRLTMANAAVGNQARVAVSGKMKQQLIKGRAARGKEVMGDVEYHTWGSGTKARFPVLKKINSVEDM